MQVSKPVTSRNKQEIRKIYNTGRTHKADGVEINSKLFLKLLLKKDGSVMRDDLVLSSIAEGNLKCGHAYQFWITFQTSTPKFYFLLLASTQVENLVKIFYDHERSWMILSRSYQGFQPGQSTAVNCTLSHSQESKDISKNTTIPEQENQFYLQLN